MTDSIDIPTHHSTSSHYKGKQKAHSTTVHDSDDSAGPDTGRNGIRSGGSVTPRSTDLPSTPRGVNMASAHSRNGGGHTQSPFQTSSSSSTSGVHGDDKNSRLSAREKGKTNSTGRPSEEIEDYSPSYEWSGGERRASLLSSSISRSEHTVVNIGEPDRPRLITCVKASQGFDWNQDIFLPSYIAAHDHTSELEHRQDPVEDIFITDEEAETMFPR